MPAVPVIPKLGKGEQLVLSELMKDVDFAYPVDCADPRANFVVVGWFVIPKGQAVKNFEVTMAS